MVHSTETQPAQRTSDPILTALRVFAVLAVLNVFSQFVTAGSFLTRGGSHALEPVHAGGAIVLHVITAIVAILALVYWRLRGAPLWPGVLAVVVFVLTIVQAWFGSGRTLYIHVPGAMILTIGTVVLAVWAIAARPTPAVGR